MGGNRTEPRVPTYKHVRFSLHSSGLMVTNMTRKAPNVYEAKAESLNKVRSIQFISGFHGFFGRRAVTKKHEKARRIPTNRAQYRTIDANPTSSRTLFRKSGKMIPPVVISCGQVTECAEVGLNKTTI
jgi:hypothetical protein